MPLLQSFLSLPSCLLDGIALSAESTKPQKKKTYKSRLTHAFFFLCVVSIIILGISTYSVVSSGLMDMTQPFNTGSFLFLAYGLCLVVVILMFYQYLIHIDLADETFTILPCKLGSRLVGISKVFRLMFKQTGEICHRCPAFQSTFLVLTVFTSLSRGAIWFHILDFVKSNLGVYAYLSLTIVFLLAMPIHMTVISIRRLRGSDLLRIITSAMFAASPFMLGALLLQAWGIV